MIFTQHNRYNRFLIIILNAKELVFFYQIGTKIKKCCYYFLF